MVDLDKNYTAALSEPVFERTMHVALLVIVALVVFLAGSGRTALTDPAEARHGLISKTMAERGRYLEPYVDDKPYFGAPPLYYWLTAVSFKLLAPGDFAARLVPAAGAALTLIAAYLIAASLFNHVVGMVAGICLLTMVATIGGGKLVQMDIYLSAFVAFAVWAFIKGYRSPEHSRWFLLMYASIGLGLLAYGLTAMLIPAALIVIFLLLQRRGDLITRMRLLYGATLIIVIAGPWFIHMIRLFPSQPGRADADHGFLHEFFVVNAAGQFGSGILSEPQRAVTYLAAVLIGLLPWTPAAGLAILRYVGPAFRRSQNDWSSQILIVWAAVVLIGSAVAGMEPVGSVFAALVPIAVLTARYLYDYRQSDFPKRRREHTFRWAYPMAMVATAVVVAALLVGAFAAVYVKFKINWSSPTGRLGLGLDNGFWASWGWLIAAVYRLAAAVILARLCLYLLRSRLLEVLAVSLAVVTVMMAIDVSYNELPRIADVLSCRRLVPEILKNSRPGDDVFVGPDRRASLAFYLADGQNRRRVRQVTDFVYQPLTGEKAIYLTTDESTYVRLRQRTEGHKYKYKHKIKILAEFGRNKLLLMHRTLN